MIALPTRRAVLVLGMHRSGTSALAGVIDALGVAGPKTPQVPDHWNPRGYFESIRFFSALDQLLAAGGSRWDDWRAFDHGWFDTPAGRQHSRSIKGLLIEELGDRPVFYVKDPRLCRMVPFVTDLLAELGADPVAVLPIRNPLEIAESLKRRNNLAMSKSLLMWLRHVLEAEYHSRAMPRCVLRYETLLSDWRSCMSRVAERTGVTWPDTSESAAAKIEQFLNSDLHREKISPQEFSADPRIRGWIGETYALLTDLAADGDEAATRQRLDVLRDEFEQGCEQFEPVVAELEAATAALASERDGFAAAQRDLVQKHDALSRQSAAVTAERDTLAQQYQAAAAERDHYREAQAELAAKYGEVLSSNSWRLTAPLRAFRRLFK